MAEPLIRVAVVGAAGRMGREVLRSLTPAHGFDIRVAIDRPESVGKSAQELAGPDAPNIVLQEKLGQAMDKDPVDVLVDFSHHVGLVSRVESALKRKVSPVIGCTGIVDRDLSAILELSREEGVPVLVVPNFAIGAVLMMRFAEMAAQWMPDAEIIEMHHDRKEDAPSGTAMLTAALIDKGRKSERTRLPVPVLRAEGARGGEVRHVPVHSVRLPGLLAHQQVMFGAPGETLTIRHDSLDRVSFMPGVRLAAKSVRSLKGLVVGLDKVLFA